jgi:hypothetical protein
MIQEWNLATTQALNNPRGSSVLEGSPVPGPTDRPIVGSSLSKDKNTNHSMENCVKNTKVKLLGSDRHLASYPKIPQGKSRDKEILKLLKK